MYWKAILSMLSFVPKKVYLYLFIVLCIGGVFYLYGDKIKKQTISSIRLELEEASRKALEKDLSLIKEQLRGSIESNEKIALRLSEELEKRGESSKKTQEVLDELHKINSKDIACNNIPSEYHSLLQSLLPVEGK